MITQVNAMNKIKINPAEALARDSRRDGFASAEEAGRFLSLSRPMITKLVASGSMPYKRFGRSLRIPWNWLLDQVEQSSNCR
jgi:excisionase family DNA binding protein